MILKSMSKELIGIRPLIHSGSDDLESFLAWSAQIKLEMSEANPLLDKVLENLAFSTHPIAGGDSFRTHSARELQIRRKTAWVSPSSTNQGGDPA